MITSTEVRQLFTDQLASWETVRERYAALQGVRVKHLEVNGFPIEVQFNPARIISSSAKIDKQSLQTRPCFLCDQNRPAEQRGLPLGDYQWLVNPFPIFPEHFTIPTIAHLPQRIAGRYGDLLRITRTVEEYIFFYNGPRCGASAPDHAHFQAGNKGFLPLEREFDRLHRTLLLSLKNARLYSVGGYIVPFFLIEAEQIEDAEELFEKVYQALPHNKEEPMLNLLMWRNQGRWITCLFPRTAHRPSCYYAEDKENILLSPASVDMGGVFITPLEKDFEKITAKEIEKILSEVSPSSAEMQQIIDSIQSSEPVVQIGILSETKIDFSLNGAYRMAGKTYEGIQSVLWDKGKILWDGSYHQELSFIPVDSSYSFTLKEVTIGVKFHWERREEQTFKGALRLIIDGEHITAINTLGIEEYLTSVISSEMSATASPELLKSHAVISRSWLLAQIQKNKRLSGKAVSTFRTDEELIRWYDREDHTLFDVCADDHCQRYQGITRAHTPQVAQAIAATRGEILTHDGTTCDARFSKCCGGMVEEFESCWENQHHPYLVPLRDCAEQETLPNLRDEEAARQWILTKPNAFCHTTDSGILSQVLNNYDQETTDFYRWQVYYTQDELARLIGEKSGIDFGDILDLIPIERGASGRLIRLKIVGSRQTLTLGKELEIRRTLSSSHLYSSAFIVEKGEIINGVPQHFTLRGAGWGHGVGLCQIGAAVMGEKGYNYTQILQHYYPGAILEKIY